MISRIAHKTVMRLAGRKRYAYYYSDRGTPYLSADEIQFIQIQKLRRLLVHANRHVPYYSKIFAECGFNPEQLRDVAGLQSLPTLDRQTLRRRSADLCSTDTGLGPVETWSTGGSTGAPATFLKSKDCIEREVACLWRSWSWAGWQPPDPMVWVWGAPQETSQVRGRVGRMKWRLGGRLLLDAFDMGEERLAGWITEMDHFRGRDVIGYATSLDTFARYLLRTNRGLDTDFKQIISTAEKLLPQQRTNIERAFGCSVRDQYGAREVRLVAFECPGGNMHVISDACVLELVPDPSVPGDAEKIFVTPLDNFAMPLIRYELGDYALTSKATCGCGINFPVITLRVGRLTDNFVLPNGRVVHGEYFTHLMYGIPGIERFQFCQETPERIVLRVVLERGVAEGVMESALRPVCDKSPELSPELDIRVEFVEKIDTTVSGKHRFTMSKLAESARSNHD